MEANWLGYDFIVYEPNTIWNEVGGVYIFCGVNESLGQWTPLYVGQTGNFRTRIPSHEKWSQALALGATRVHARAEVLEDDRVSIERRLIREFDPPLNRR